MLIQLSLGLTFLWMAWLQPMSISTDDDWSMVKESESIKVYKSNQDNGYKDIRIEAIFEATIEDLVGVLNDVDNYPVWVFKCKEAERLGATKSGFLRYRMISDFPFPFKDRELVAVSSSHVDRQGVYHSSSHAEWIDRQDSDCILVPKFDAKWTVRTWDVDKIRVEYEVSTHPGGMIPAWLYNMAVDLGPFKTMEALQKQLEESI